MREFLKGRKTYLFAALMVIAGGLFQQGYISEGTFKALEAVLMGGGLAALRAGMSKTQP